MPKIHYFNISARRTFDICFYYLNDSFVVPYELLQVRADPDNKSHTAVIFFYSNLIRLISINSNCRRVCNLMELSVSKMDLL